MTTAEQLAQRAIEVRGKMQNESRQYRKRPVVIEAIRWQGDNFMALLDWGCPAAILPATDMQSLVIGTLEDGPNCEAVHVATLGDWIIRGIKGEFYPCKPDIFEGSYDRVVTD